MRTLVCGRSGCGKTYLMIQMLKDAKKKLKNKSDIYLISPSAKKQKIYIENSKLFNHFYDSFDEKVMDHVTQSIETSKKNGKKPIVILDDTGGMPYMRSSHMSPTKFDQMVINARHIGVDIVTLIQKMTQVNPIYRDNTDMGIFFKPYTKREDKTLDEEFLGMIEENSNKKKLKDFCFKDKYDYLKVYRDGNDFKLYHNERELNLGVEKSLTESDDMKVI